MRVDVVAPVLRVVLDDEDGHLRPELRVGEGLDDAAEGEEAEFLLPIEDMSEAKLMLTDDLVTEALRREKSAKRKAREARKEVRREERHSRHRPQRPAAKGGE